MLESLFTRHLEEDEPLHMVVHQHAFFVVKALLLPLLALLGTWAVAVMIPRMAVILVILLADGAILLWGMRNFLNEFLDAWLITDRSVIDVAWHGWFHRQSTRIDYASIEGVSYEIQGMLGTLLRFGTVTIEKVGTGSTVSLAHVRNPRVVESAILTCQETCIRTKHLKDSTAVKDLIAEIVAERVHLRGFRGKKKTTSSSR